MNHFFLRLSDKLVILFTLLFAFVLTVLPVPADMAYFYPNFLLLFVLAWVLLLPHRLNLGFAWINGLCIDSLQGVLWGENALCFLITSYFIFKFHRLINHFNGLIQTVIIFTVLLIYDVLLFWLENLQGHSLPARWIVFNALGGAMIWLPLWLLLKKIKQKYYLT